MKNEINWVQVEPVVATVDNDVTGFKKLVYEEKLLTLSIIPVPFSTVLVSQIIPN